VFIGIQSITYKNKNINGTKMKRCANYLILTLYAMKPHLSFRFIYNISCVRVIVTLGTFIN